MQLVQVGRHRARRRHPRELRELVDQPLERLDLADDRRRALVDERARGRRARRRSGAAAARRDSWIGVSGFLISCARRRATSRQAATFCARMSGVTSSSTSTAPFARAALADERRGDRRQVQLRGRRAPARSPAPPARLPRPAAAVDERGQRLQVRRGRTRRAAGWPTTVGRGCSSRAAARLIVVDAPAGVDRDDAGRDALEDRLDVAAARLRPRRACARARTVDRSTLRRLCGQLAGHRVERLDERAELVVALAARRAGRGGRRRSRARPPPASAPAA